MIGLNEIQWITPEGYIGRRRETEDFSFQLEAVLSPESPDVGSPVSFYYKSGILPLNLTISETGLISGSIIDMDEYVPEFIGTGVDIERDGSTYATVGSAAAGIYDCEFVVIAKYGDVELERSFYITVINHYSSDRDQMIRDYTEKFGNSFQVDGVPSTAEEYLQYMKAKGYYP